ncbi:MAG: UPF0182 family protein [Lewinellaceae bacterium]|nr:UPF0182 family protein [Lewinellaceae bacterium]
MFTLLFLVLAGLGALIVFRSLGRKNRKRVAAGGALIVITVLFFLFLNFWGEKLWFDTLGYNDRFWTLFLAQTGFVAAGGLLAFGFISGLLYALPKGRKLLRNAAYALAILMGGLWGFANWNVFLQFWHKINTSLADPILGQDTGFYFFTLPFLDQVYSILLSLSIVGLAVSYLARFTVLRDGNNVSFGRVDDIDEHRSNRLLFLNGGILLLVLAGGKYLDRFHLLYSELGAVSGPGWTDVHIILPTLMAVMILTALMGIFLFVPSFRNAIWRLLFRLGAGRDRQAEYTLGSVAAVVAAVWFIGLHLIPGTFQSFRVEPNEISYEEPYIRNNIEFTRHGFNLHQIEDREFPVEESFTREMVENNQTIFKNIRLWDWRALDAVLKQFQEIRLYYEFNNVDIDRYTFGGQYRQVMISAREMVPGNLPPESQTFVNKVFKYTHGYGVALTTVTEFTPEGLPNLLVKNIPPESQYAELAVSRPQIYYGELTDNYVITNSVEPEFDYPQGEENQYVSYAGKGGVQLSNFWRKLVYAYKMGDFKLLLSSYPTSESRIMFDRQIEKRVKKLAPFLDLDGDPYIVNANGELYWMLDAYTTSEYFPYSEPFSSREEIQFKEGEQQRSLRIQHRRAFEGINYIRNSVKVTVNAYDGNVSFYIFDENDPLIRVWDEIFPGMMKKREEMPPALLAHIRYPVDYLMVQGLVYAKYHMGDPEVFYNQEDLWIRATEKYYGEVQPVEPYYIMWQQPEATEAEFSLILPFTPKNRQVSIGWIAGLCDPDNYGRFLAYSFPKEKRVLGPQQVETKIDQNSFLSGQLSLWDQRGSRVIRGNVLAIPIENTIFYVEPIYLQAETAAYPELRLVCVMHDDKLSYAQTFQEALEGLFGEAPAAPERAEGQPAAAVPATADLIQQAQRAFDDYLEATGQKRFEDASQALHELEQALEGLSGKEGSMNQEPTAGQQ